MQMTIGGFPVAGAGDFSHAETRTIEAVAITTKITSLNTNVPDRVFIMTLVWLRAR